MEKHWFSTAFASRQRSLHFYHLTVYFPAFGINFVFYKTYSSLYKFYAGLMEPQKTAEEKNECIHVVNDSLFLINAHMEQYNMQEMPFQEQLFLSWFQGFLQT